MTNILRIKNASFYAYHGALKEEQHIGGKFEADVDLYTDFSEAVENDDLTKTVNYVDVYKFINNIITKVCVRVRKNSVPVGGLIDYVEAEVIKENGK